MVTSETGQVNSPFSIQAGGAAAVFAGHMSTPWPNTSVT